MARSCFFASILFFIFASTSFAARPTFDPFVLSTWQDDGVFIAPQTSAQVGSVFVYISLPTSQLIGRDASRQLWATKLECASPLQVTACATGSPRVTASVTFVTCAESAYLVDAQTGATLGTFATQTLGGGTIGGAALPMPVCSSAAAIVPFQIQETSNTVSSYLTLVSAQNASILIAPWGYTTDHIAPTQISVVDADTFVVVFAGAVAVVSPVGQTTAPWPADAKSLRLPDDPPGDNAQLTFPRNNLLAATVSYLGQTSISPLQWTTTSVGVASATVTDVFTGNASAASVPFVAFDSSPDGFVILAANAMQAVYITIAADQQQSVIVSRASFALIDGGALQQNVAVLQVAGELWAFTGSSGSGSGANVAPVNLGLPASSAVVSCTLSAQSVFPGVIFASQGGWVSMTSAKQYTQFHADDITTSMWTLDIGATPAAAHCGRDVVTLVFANGSANTCSCRGSTSDFGSHLSNAVIVDERVMLLQIDNNAISAALIATEFELWTTPPVAGRVCLTGDAVAASGDFYFVVLVGGGAVIAIDQLTGNVTRIDLTAVWTPTCIEQLAAANARAAAVLPGQESEDEYLIAQLSVMFDVAAPTTTPPQLVIVATGISCVTAVDTTRLIPTLVTTLPVAPVGGFTPWPFPQQAPRSAVLVDALLTLIVRRGGQWNVVTCAAAPQGSPKYVGNTVAYVVTNSTVDDDENVSNNATLLLLSAAQPDGVIWEVTPADTIVDVFSDTMGWGDSLITLSPDATSLRSIGTAASSASLSGFSAAIQWSVASPCDGLHLIAKTLECAGLVTRDGIVVIMNRRTATLTLLNATGGTTIAQTTLGQTTITRVEGLTEDANRPAVWVVLGTTGTPVSYLVATWTGAVVATITCDAVAARALNCVCSGTQLRLVNDAVFGVWPPRAIPVPLGALASVTPPTLPLGGSAALDVKDMAPTSWTPLHNASVPVQQPSPAAAVGSGAPLSPWSATVIQDTATVTASHVLADGSIAAVAGSTLSVFYGSTGGLKCSATLPAVPARGFQIDASGETIVLGSAMLALQAYSASTCALLWTANACHNSFAIAPEAGSVFVMEMQCSDSGSTADNVFNMELLNLTTGIVIWYVPGTNFGDNTYASGDNGVFALGNGNAVLLSGFSMVWFSVTNTVGVLNTFPTGFVSSTSATNPNTGTSACVLEVSLGVYNLMMFDAVGDPVIGQTTSPPELQSGPPSGEWQIAVLDSATVAIVCASDIVCGYNTTTATTQTAAWQFTAPSFFTFQRVVAIPCLNWVLAFFTTPASGSSSGIFCLDEFGATVFAVNVAMSLVNNVAMYATLSADQTHVFVTHGSQIANIDISNRKAAFVDWLYVGDGPAIYERPAFVTTSMGVAIVGLGASLASVPSFLVADNMINAAITLPSTVQSSCDLASGAIAFVQNSELFTASSSASGSSVCVSQYTLPSPSTSSPVMQCVGSVVAITLEDRLAFVDTLTATSVHVLLSELAVRCGSAVSVPCIASVEFVGHGTWQLVTEHCVFSVTVVPPAAAVTVTAAVMPLFTGSIVDFIAMPEGPVVLTLGGVVAAFDGALSPVWQRPAIGECQRGAVAADASFDHVVCPVTGAVTSVAVVDGSVGRVVELANVEWTPGPLAFNQTVLVAGNLGLYCLTTNMQAASPILWYTEPPAGNGFDPSASTIRAMPVATGFGTVISSHAAQMSSIDVASGSVVWNLQVPGTCSQLLLNGGLVLALCGGQALVVDSVIGEQLFDLGAASSVAWQSPQTQNTVQITASNVVTIVQLPADNVLPPVPAPAPDYTVQPTQTVAPYSAPTPPPTARPNAGNVTVLATMPALATFRARYASGIASLVLSADNTVAVSVQATSDGVLQLVATTFVPVAPTLVLGVAWATPLAQCATAELSAVQVVDAGPFGYAALCAQGIDAFDATGAAIFSVAIPVAAATINVTVNAAVDPADGSVCFATTTTATQNTVVACADRQNRLFTSTAPFENATVAQIVAPAARYIFVVWQGADGLAAVATYRTTGGEPQGSVVLCDPCTSWNFDPTWQFVAVTSTNATTQSSSTDIVSTVAQGGGGGAQVITTIAYSGSVTVLGAALIVAPTPSPEVILVATATQFIMVYSSANGFSEPIWSQSVASQDPLPTWLSVDAGCLIKSVSGSFGAVLTITPPSSVSMTVIKSTVFVGAVVAATATSDGTAAFVQSVDTTAALDLTTFEPLWTSASVQAQSFVLTTVARPPSPGTAAGACAAILRSDAVDCLPLVRSGWVVQGPPVENYAPSATVTPLVSLQGGAIVVNAGDSLVALNATTGNQLWTVGLPSVNNVTDDAARSLAIMVMGSVVASVPQGVWLIDPATGALQASAALNANGFGNGPLVDATSLSYFGVFTGATGGLYVAFVDSATVSVSTIHTTVQALTVSLHSQVLTWLGADGILRGVNPSTMAEAWRVRLPVGSTTATLGVVNAPLGAYVFVVASDGALRVLGAVDGRLYGFVTGSLLPAIATWNATVYVTDGDFLYAFADQAVPSTAGTAAAAASWSVALSGGDENTAIVTTISVTPSGVILVSTADGSIWGVDAVTQTVLWFVAGAPVQSSAVVCVSATHDVVAVQSGQAVSIIDANHMRTAASPVTRTPVVASVILDALETVPAGCIRTAAGSAGEVSVLLSTLQGGLAADAVLVRQFAVMTSPPGTRPQTVLPPPSGSTAGPSQTVIPPSTTLPPSVPPGDAWPSLNCEVAARTAAAAFASCVNGNALSPAVTSLAELKCDATADLVSQCRDDTIVRMGTECAQGLAWLQQELAAVQTGSAVLPYCSQPATCFTPQSSAAVCTALTLPSAARRVAMSAPGLPPNFELVPVVPPFTTAAPTTASPTTTTTTTTSTAAPTITTAPTGAPTGAPPPTTTTATVAPAVPTTTTSAPSPTSTTAVPTTTAVAPPTPSPTATLNPDDLEFQLTYASLQAAPSNETALNALLQAQAVELGFPSGKPVVTTIISMSSTSGSHKNADEEQVTFKFEGEFRRAFASALATVIATRGGATVGALLGALFARVIEVSASGSPSSGTSASTITIAVAASIAGVAAVLGAIVYYRRKKRRTDLTELSLINSDLDSTVPPRGQDDTRASDVVSNASEVMNTRQGSVVADYGAAT